MKITICGSIYLINDLVKVKHELKTFGHKVKLPHKAEILLRHDDRSETISSKKKTWYMKKHIEKIDWADAILVVNVTKNGIENYIGGNTFLEMGFAFITGKPIFLLNPIPEMGYTSEMKGMQPIVLDNDLSKIKNYYLLKNYKIANEYLKKSNSFRWSER